MQIKELETPRLRLRSFCSEDLDDLCHIFSNRAVIKFIGDGGPASRSHTRWALDTIIGHYELHGFGRLALIEKVTGKLIGYCGLRNFAGVPELVYLLDEPYWNRGLATEAALECLRFGFESLGSERIVAMAKPENTASLRVLQKIQMNCDGPGTFHGCPIVLYSLQKVFFNRMPVPATLDVVQSVSFG